jgi:hypothetical protein
MLRGSFCVLKRRVLVEMLEKWLHSRTGQVRQAQWRRQGHRLHADALAGFLPLPRLGARR